MGTSEPGKRPQPAAPVLPAVGETRHAASAPASPEPAQAKADTVPAESGPGDGWTVAADPAAADGRPSIRGERYVFGEELGRGGMGRVVEANDTRLGRKVAIKEALPRGVDLRRRFEREVRITARLEHPSIVPLYDAGTSPAGNPYYVMRKVSGRPLDKLITDAKDLGERLTLLPNLLAATDAIAHAHLRDVVHRDLKPANVLVGEHGETVVIDWGLAKALGEDDDDDDPIDDSLAPSDAVETQAGAVFGTPGFMAPEQARGEPLDARSDVYALGATLYQLLSGRPPHSGTTATEVIDRSLAERPPPLPALVPGVPPELVTIADKALAYHRDQRYRDAGALAEDLRRFQNGQLVAAHRYTPRQRIGRFLRRHRAAMSVAAAATIALVVGGIVSVRGIMSERDRAQKAEHDANKARTAAEIARDREADRADELLITQARALVDVNPTAALAALKLVKPTSRWLRNARMVAMSAIARGAAFGYPGHGLVTATLEIAPDGRRLLSAGEAHGFRIDDLDRHDAILTVDFPERIDATWIAKGASVLVAPSKTGGLIVFDATSGARKPIAWGPNHRAIAMAAPEAADRVYLVDETHAIDVLDLRTGTIEPFPLAGVFDDITVADDGSWMIASAHDRVMVVRTADAKVLGDLPGQGVWEVISDDGKLGAASVDGHVKLFAVDGDKLTVTAIEPRSHATPDYPGDLLFRGDELFVAWIGSALIDVFGADGKLQSTLAPHAHVMAGATGRDEVVAYGDMKGELLVVVGGSFREVRAPSEVQLKLLAARANSRYIAIAAENLILVWDLDRLTPMHLALPSTQTLTFRDNDTLLVSPMEQPWELIDLRSGEVDKLVDTPPFAALTRVTVGSDRRILGDMLGMGLVLIHPDSPKLDMVADVAVEGFTLMSNNRFAYGTKDGHLVFGTSRADRRVVMAGGAAVEVIAPAGDGVVALTADNIVIRIDGAGREQNRVQLDGIARALAVDAAGRVIIALDDRIVAWNGARVDAIADLDATVMALDIVSTGIIAQTSNGDTFHITPDGVAHRVLALTNNGVRVAHAAGEVMSTLGDGQLVVVDLASGERTVLPQHGVMTLPVISEDGRRVVYVDGGEMCLWSLDAPTEPGAWSAWLDEQTNAEPSTDPDVTWPWQKGP